MLCRVGGRNWGGIVPLPKINWRYKIDGRSTEAELRRLVRNTNAYIRRHNAKLPKNVLPVKTYSFKELRNNITTRKEFNQYVSEFKSLRNKNAFDIVETDNFTTVKFNENLYKTLLNRMNMKTAEEAKVAVRSIRRDGIDTAKTAQKNGEMTEDELSVAEAKIQKMTDANIAEIDQILEKKEKEIMTV